MISRKAGALRDVILLAPAFVLAAAVHAQDRREQQQQQAQPEQASSRAQRGSWDPARLYGRGWSADEMIGTAVRGDKGGNIGDVKDILVAPDGTVSRVVVEVGGFVDIGDQRIADIARFGPFDYAQFAKQSRYAGARDDNAGRQEQGAARTR